MSCTCPPVLFTYFTCTVTGSVIGYFLADILFRLLTKGQR